MEKMIAPTLEETDLGLEFHVNRDVHFIFSNKKSIMWLKDRCADGYHEPAMSQLLVEYLRSYPSAIFFDVGALYGYFGLLALALSKSEAKIFEFEMNPESFVALTQNIAANTHLQPGRIVAVNCAVGDVDAADQMTRYKGMILNSVDTGSHETPMNFITLDSFCRTRGFLPNLMKIDVEGYEGKILKGAASILRASETVIMLELHNNKKLLRASGTTRCNLLESLLNDGCGLYYFGKHRSTNSLGARRLSAEYLCSQREKFDAMGDDLVLISTRDIRLYWPNLEIVESFDHDPQS